MSWELTSDKPIYIQLVEHIQFDIISGKYQPGGKIEPVRELAIKASVNPNTMQKAMSVLEQSGLIHSNRTSGRFITEDKELIAELKSSIAEAYCRDFAASIKKLGYSKDEISGILNKYL